MSSPSTETSSGSSLFQSCSEVVHQAAAAAIDRKKQRRTLSNRESARRSRMRKQKHLDDLTAQADRLRRENGQISASLALATQRYFFVEADNSVLRTRMMELRSRLRSLDEILRCLHGGGGFFPSCDGSWLMDDGLVGPWTSVHAVMAPADNMLEY